MADWGRSEFCVVFTTSLSALELKQTLISLLFKPAALKLGKQTLKSYLNITCEFQLRSPPNEKVSVVKDCG